MRASWHLAGHARFLQRTFIAAADLRVFIFVVDQSAALFYVYVDPILAALGCNLEADRVEPAAEAQRQVARRLRAGIEVLMKPPAGRAVDAPLPPADLHHLIGLSAFIGSNA